MFELGRLTPGFVRLATLLDCFLCKLLLQGNIVGYQNIKLAYLGASVVTLFSTEIPYLPHQDTPVG